MINCIVLLRCESMVSLFESDVFTDVVAVGVVDVVVHVVVIVHVRFGMTALIRANIILLENFDL